MSASQPGGSGRVGIVENWELRQHKTRDANSGAFKGILFVVAALLLITIGGWFAARPVLGPALTDTFEEHPGIINYPVIGDVVAAEFADRLDQPAAASDQEIEFVIEPGQSVADIQANLVDEGLLKDEPAFMYAVVRDRVDQLIKSGTYTMTPQITPAGIAARLKADPDPPTPVMALDMRPGRRIEQTVAYLQKLVEETDLEVDPKEFLRLARNPGNKLRNQYTFLKQSPEGSSLEGFLYPGTYEVPIDITAEELIHQMLGEWDDQAGKYVNQARNKKIDFWTALRIASLVEREAKVDSDRQKIATVYWNRLDSKKARKAGTNGLLQADPTVVYATDSMALADLAVKNWDDYLFWDLLGRADYSTVNVDPRYDSFQTYQNQGLPDWPIVTPTAKSIAAALDPKTKSKLMFFYACEDSDTHKFGKTAKQHQKNINSCN
jgi:UPF0755 protein